MMQVGGVISDRLRRLFSPNDPGWTYHRPEELATPVKTKMPKGVRGTPLKGRKKRK